MKELPKPIFDPDNRINIERYDEKITIDKIQKTPLGTFYSRVSKPKPKPSMTPVLTSSWNTNGFNNAWRNLQYVEEITPTKDELKSLGATAISKPYTEDSGKAIFGEKTFPNNFFVDCLKCGHHINKLRDFFNHGIIVHSLDPTYVCKSFYDMLDQIYKNE